MPGNYKHHAYGRKNAESVACLFFHGKDLLGLYSNSLALGFPVALYVPNEGFAVCNIFVDKNNRRWICSCRLRIS